MRETAGNNMNHSKGSYTSTGANNKQVSSNFSVSKFSELFLNKTGFGSNIRFAQKSVKFKGQKWSRFYSTSSIFIYQAICLSIKSFYTIFKQNVKYSNIFWKGTHNRILNGQSHFI